MIFYLPCFKLDGFSLFFIVGSFVCHWPIVYERSLYIFFWHRCMWSVCNSYLLIVQVLTRVRWHMMASTGMPPKPVLAVLGVRSPCSVVLFYPSRVRSSALGRVALAMTKSAPILRILHFRVPVHVRPGAAAPNSTRAIMVVVEEMGTRAEKGQPGVTALMLTRCPCKWICLAYPVKLQAWTENLHPGRRQLRCMGSRAVMNSLQTLFICSVSATSGLPILQICPLATQQIQCQRSRWPPRDPQYLLWKDSLWMKTGSNLDQRTITHLHCEHRRAFKRFHTTALWISAQSACMYSRGRRRMLDHRWAVAGTQLVHLASVNISHH